MSFSERDQRDFQQAAGLHQAGNLPAAIEAYRKLLKRSPKQPIVLNLLGLAEFQSGQLEAAARDLGKALALDPRIPDIHYNLATVLQRLGRYEESIPHFERAIAAKPNDADAHMNFGIALKSLGRTDDAMRAYERALALDPNHAGAHLNLGNALAAQGRQADAIPHLEKSIALQPRNSDAYISLGNALRALERAQESLIQFDRAIAINPNVAEAYACKGLALASLKKYDEAAGHFLRATQIKPDFAEAYVELGHALQKIDRHEDALRSYQEAINRKPDFAEAYFCLAEIFSSLERYDEMREPLQKAIALKPDYAEAISLLGGYYCIKRQYAESERLLEKSLELDRCSALTLFLLADLYALTDRSEEAIQYLNQALATAEEIQDEKSWTLGITYLSLGELSRGWEFFERRFLRPIHKRPAFREYSAPLWDGKKVEGKLLVWGEQGLGDEIIYSSMLPELENFADAVIVECSPRLVPLFKRSFPTIKVVPIDPEKLYPGEIAAHCSMASLGKFLRPNMESFPNIPPAYLRADENRARGLRKLITADSKYAIGVSWRSANVTLGEMKSASLTDFAPFLAIQNCRFVDLQYGDTQDERQQVELALGVNVSPVDGVDNTQDLDGLAALVSSCDAVVTTSNTTAHLAGALGKPTWVLLPYGQARIWYWFKRRADSPWYPNVHLVRQGLDEPWASVAQRAAAEVRQFLMRTDVQ